MYPDSNNFEGISLFATTQTTATNSTVKWVSVGESTANLVIDSISLLAFILLYIPTLIVYIKRESWLLGWLIINSRLCGKKGDLQDSTWPVRLLKRFVKVDEKKNNQKTQSKGFFFLLLHSLLVFYLMRIGHEIVTIIQHVFELQRIESDFETTKQVRRIFDYISIYWYLFNYTLILPIWLKVCMSWMGQTTKKKAITITIYVILILCNIAAFVGLAPLVVMAILALAHPTIDYEKTRRYLMYGMAAPLGGLAVLAVLAMSIACVAIIIHMIKATSKSQPEDGELYILQKQTIVKLTVAVVILGIGVIVRLVAVAIYAIDLPSYVIYPLVKAIPDVSFALCVILIFWPYRLPVLSHPVQFVMQELKYSTKVILEKKDEIVGSNVMKRKESVLPSSSTNPVRISSVMVILGMNRHLHPSINQPMLVQ
ncbi:predicted protein [Naegleria gruberi]|uniref:Predicted protein n=1 Tax=Naegleria gruberi TaxID=5762 RepID=D2VTK5_NAEGR|nr:uncharacterized protein NAEGRDRAFT_52137 [Naegleria gruberi]EFC39946.1 predicted protein [Naegleria gruberi]|eukprot:XP_002672690.1 predicted protein [Naegleria gruberi strain NEG-M]